MWHVLVTDMVALQDVAAVERCHALMFECFNHLVSRNHTDDPLFIAHVITVLVKLRSLKERHFIVEGRFVMEWSHMVDFPPLMIEMWSSTT